MACEKEAFAALSLDPLLEYYRDPKYEKYRTAKASLKNLALPEGDLPLVFHVLSKIKVIG